MIRVMIADDEALARQRMERLLGGLEDVEVVGVYASGEEVLEALKQEPADVLFLDIRMPGLDGLDTSALVGADGPAVVFTTAYEEYALQAFGVGAVDYLVKPIEAKHLVQALGRVRARVSAAPGAGPVAISTPRGIRVLGHDEVVCAVYEGETLQVWALDGPFYADVTLSDLERMLPDPPFVRVHRRGLVNLTQVGLLEPLETGGYVAQMRTGPKVAVSRQAARALRRRLGLGKG